MNSANKLVQNAPIMPRKAFQGGVAPKFVRTIPKNIMQDKEALYDNTLQLKQYANALVEDNHRLKAKLQQFEEELSRKTKLLNGLMAQMSNISSMQGIQRMQKETHLIDALKQRVKKLEGILMSRDDEITTLKQNVKLTKLNEYESQLNICEKECIRLRGMLEELLNSKHVGNPTEYVEIEEKILEQSMMIKDLQAKNSEISQNLDRKTQQCEKLTEKIKELEDQISKNSKKTDRTAKRKRVIVEYKDKIAELNTEIAQLKEELEKRPEADNKSPGQGEKEKNMKLFNDMQKDMSEMKKNMEEYKKKADEANRNLFEKDGIIKRTQDKLKFQEDEFNVKLIQERETFTKKIKSRIFGFKLIF